MLMPVQDRIEPKWIDMFEEAFALCNLRRGEVVAILSESQSRAVLVDLAELALSRMGARLYHVRVPSPRAAHAVAVRSTGASVALGGLRQVIDAVAGADLVVDCTVEGLLHSPERKDILARGARMFMISNEHPDVLERFRPDIDLQRRCVEGAQMISAARTMRVTSAAGTDLTIELEGVQGRGSAGLADRPGIMGYWPAGLCLCFPRARSVDGTLVLAPGDVNLTFKRFVESPIRLAIEQDFIRSIDGDGVDAELLRSYFAAWDDPLAYTVSHVGWGMNPGARWDSLAMYDRSDHNGTELRAFAGNFLYSTGANETAGRYTTCHFDMPMRGCTVQLDDRVVVREGVLQAPLAPPPPAPARPAAAPTSP
jgi:2,5-dihydroxypyridine 5,6-dioxygenase